MDTSALEQPRTIARSRYFNAALALSVTVGVAFAVAYAAPDQVRVSAVPATPPPLPAPVVAVAPHVTWMTGFDQDSPGGTITGTIWPCSGLPYAMLAPSERPPQLFSAPADVTLIRGHQNWIYAGHGVYRRAGHNARVAERL